MDKQPIINMQILNENIKKLKNKRKSKKNYLNDDDNELEKFMKYCKDKINK